MSDTRNLTGRTLDVLEALCGYAASGATNGELAQAARTSAPNVTRCMAQLIAKGWARKSDETGRFYPAPAFTRLTFRVTADLDRVQTRLDDQRRAFTGQ
jgi:DNA-binding IclR family transcriptional regulator